MKLYKYFSYSANSLSVLINKKLWCAHPSTLNDPFDCSFSVENMGSTSEAITKYQNEVAICCFSEKNDSILMWSHYADSHKGFCIEFDIDMNSEGIEKVFQKVDYVEDNPKFHINLESRKMRASESDEDLEFNKLFLTKFKDWEYEQEWRMFPRLNTSEPNEYEHGKFFHFKNDFKINIIYFGLKINETHKETIKNILGTEVIYKHMIPTAKSFKLSAI